AMSRTGRTPWTACVTWPRTTIHPNPTDDLLHHSTFITPPEESMTGRARATEGGSAMDGRDVDRRQFVRRTAAAGALALGAGLPTLARTRARAQEAGANPTFRSPMINLYSHDLVRAASFYADLGFVETFRTPTSGPPEYVELELEGFTLGIVAVEAARVHGLRPEGEGRWVEVVLWTDDTDGAVDALTAKGAPLLSPAHDFLDGRLRSAWIADPDGNPIQLVQRNT
ncbi:MAG: VOC family protein, partial [Gemmatimonadota bacterium]